jgi:hypothetical protein
LRLLARARRALFYYLNDPIRLLAKRKTALCYPAVALDYRFGERALAVYAPYSRSAAIIVKTVRRFRIEKEAMHLAHVAVFRVAGI